MPRWGIGFGAERLGLITLEFPRVAALLMFALLIVIGASLPRVSFDDDIHRVFLSDSPLSQAQRKFDADQSPPLSTILVHISASDVFTAADMSSLRALSLDLEFVDGVTAVGSPFVLRWPPTHANSNGSPLFKAVITDSFTDDLRTFAKLGTGLPTLLNDTNTAMLLSVSVDVSQTPIGDAVVAVRTEVDRALPENLTANLTGEDVISAEIVSGLKEDLIALNLWGALIVTLAAVALLRDLRMALLAVVPALGGAAGVLALSVWLGYPVTVLSNVIPILLLVLGVADGVHLTGHLKDNGTVESAVRDVGPACALTALTTALAFASITLTGNVQLFEFAVLGALGTLLAFVIVIVMFALLGRKLRLSRRSIPPFSAAFARMLADLGTARPAGVVVICLLLLGAATLGFSKTKAWFPLYQNLPDQSRTLATNDAVAKDFGGVFQMIVLTDTWGQTRQITQNLETQGGAQSVVSLANLARWLGTPEVEPTANQLRGLPTSIADQLRGPDGQWRIFVSMQEPMRSDDTLSDFDASFEAATQAGATQILGLPAVMRQEAVTLIGQLSLGLVIAALGATLLVALAFRELRLVPILLIPNVLPLMLTGASLHIWAQGQLTPTAVLALTIAFGIAIDDTVHFLNRFSTATRDGLPCAEAVRHAAQSAGQVMVLTTLLLTAGLCVTLLSDFTPIRLFGGMMITTLWAALLVDLVLLPALLTRKETPDGLV